MRPNNGYSIDDGNHLFVSNNKENLPINGSFSIEKDNRLVYWLNETPAWRRKYKLPEKIAFTGHWKLNSNYDLELEVQRDKDNGNSPSRRASMGQLALKGEIISCESDKLVFQIKSVNKNGLTTFSLLKLSGAWKADAFNQIYFSVDKKENPDILTLQGTWRLNQNQQIVYTYEKTCLKTKNKVLSMLAFSGFWQISQANQLTYILSGGGSSRFDFKVQLESPNIYPKDGAIKYRLGIGLKQPRVKNERIISLYGVWKFSRKFGLTFDMEYEKGRVYSFVFGAEVDFNKNNEMIFNLNSESGERIGFSVIFSHKFLKKLDAELFLRLKRAQEESGVDTGVRIPF